MTFFRSAAVTIAAAAFGTFTGVSGVASAAPVHSETRVAHSTAHHGTADSGWGGRRLIEASVADIGAENSGGDDSGWGG